MTLIEKLEKEIAEGEAVLENLENMPSLFTLHTGTMTGLNMALDIVKSHSDWVSVSERLPEPYQNVLLFKNGNLNGKPAKYVAIGFIDDEGYWAYDDIFGKHLYKVPEYTTGSDLDSIEFWQPLPQPPSEVPHATDN